MRGRLTADASPPRVVPVASSAWLFVWLVLAAGAPSLAVAQATSDNETAVDIPLTTAVPISTPAPPNLATGHIEVLNSITSGAITGRASPIERRVTISCAKSEVVTWSNQGCRTTAAIYLRSIFSNEDGFNDRIPSLFNPATISCGARDMYLYMSFDPFYKVPPGGDEVIVRFSPVVAIGAELPWDWNDTNARVAFRIEETIAYESQVALGVRYAAEVCSTVALLGAAIMMRRPMIAAMVPRLQFFRSLAICEFERKYNLGFIQYPMQLPFGDTAYQFFIPVSPLNFALFVFVILVDCLVFFAWSRFADRNQRRNIDLLPPGIRDMALKQLAEGETLQIAGGSANVTQPERQDTDFFVLKTLASQDEAVARSKLGLPATTDADDDAGQKKPDAALSEKKKARLEKEAEEKLQRTVESRRKERAEKLGLAGSDSDDGDDNDDAKKDASPRRPKDDAPDPTAPEDPPRPDDEEAKAQRELEEEEAKREAEEARLANRTPDEVDRDLAAAESNLFLKLRIHARRVKRKVVDFLAVHLTIVLIFFRFLGAGRLPSPWWWLVFLWIQPATQAVLVVLWNLEGRMVVQALVAFSAVPWIFMVLWIVRVLLIGFPMRPWDEDKASIDEETAMRAERAAGRAEQLERHEETRRMLQKRIDEKTAVLRESQSEARAAKRREAKKAKEGDANSDGAAGDDKTNPADTDDADQKKDNNDVTRKKKKEEGESNTSSSDDDDDDVEPDDELQKMRQDLEAQEAQWAAEVDVDAKRVFPPKGTFDALVEGYGRWITAFDPPDSVDLDTKRKARRMDELRADRDSWAEKQEAEREAHKAKLDADIKAAEADKPDEEKKEEEELLKGDDVDIPKDDDKKSDGGKSGDEKKKDGKNSDADDDDADSVITHISESQHRGKPIYSLCQPLPSASLPDADDAKICAQFARAYSDLFDMYRPLRHWFSIVELAASILFGVLESVRTAQGCVVIAGPAMGLCAAYLVAHCILRPCTAPLDNVFFIAIAAVQLWCCVFFLSFSLEESNVDLETAGTAGLIGLEFVLPLYLLLHMLRMAQPLSDWVEANKRAWFTKYPWLKESVLARPLGFAADSLAKLKLRLVAMIAEAKQARIESAKAAAERKERVKAKKRRREARIAAGLDPSESDDEPNASAGGDTKKLGHASKNDDESANLTTALLRGKAHHHTSVGGMILGSPESDDEIEQLAGAELIKRRQRVKVTDQRAVVDAQDGAGSSYTSYTSASHISSDEESAYEPPRIPSSATSSLTTTASAVTSDEGSCSDSACSCRNRKQKKPSSSSSAFSKSQGSSSSGSNGADEERTASSSFTVSDDDDSLSNVSSSTCASLQFEDEHGRLLTLKEVADRLREWQMQRQMPNVTPDMLPMPVEDLRALIRTSGVAADQEDEALLRLVTELQANASKFSHLQQPKASADLAAAEEGAGGADGTANAKDSAAGKDSDSNAKKLPSPSLHDQAAVARFEAFFGRRPRTCCVIM